MEEKLSQYKAAIPNIPSGHDRKRIERLLQDAITLSKRDITFARAWEIRARAQAVLEDRKLAYFHSLAEEILNTRPLKKVLNM